MKSQRLQPNPRFAEFAAVLGAHPEWLQPWSGTFFRFQTIDFPAAKDVLSGDGARVHGGRWNQPGLATVYGSTTDRTALEECKANDRYYGVQTIALACWWRSKLNLPVCLISTRPGFAGRWG